MTNESKIEKQPGTRCFILYNYDNGDKIGVFLLSRALQLVYGYSKGNTMKASFYVCAQGKAKRVLKTGHFPHDVAVRFGTDQDAALMGEKGYHFYDESYAVYLPDFPPVVVPTGEKRCTCCGEKKALKHFSGNGKAAKCKQCHNEVYNNKLTGSLEHIARTAYVWP